MRKLIGSACLVAFGIAASQSTAAVTAFSETFDSYTSGSALVGQGPWLQTGTSTATPILVGSDPISSSLSAVVGTSGQDVYAPFTYGVPRIAGNSMDTTMTIDVTSAQTAGDYFTHLSDPAGTTSVFLERLFVKSTTGGYLLGLEPTAGGGGAITYGTTVLPLSTLESVDVTWNFAAGTTSDTFAVAVGGAPYAGLTSIPYGSTTPLPAQISSFNLRQGTAASAPGVDVDNITVTATAVPEPTSLGLLALASAGFLGRRRRLA
jgi:hypothetical protein